MLWLRFRLWELAGRAGWLLHYASRRRHPAGLNLTRTSIQRRSALLDRRKAALDAHRPPFWP